LGGNIGRSLLDDLPAIGPNDDVVLELSSFQLARLSDGARGVDLAVITNCTPNHLDWHGAYDEYRQAKQRLLRMQPATGRAVLNVDDPEVVAWQNLARGKVSPPLADLDIPPLIVCGDHQRSNARLAATAAIDWGADQTAVEAGLRQFTGLPHRLERVRSLEQRTFYNDSLSTTPESTIAALATFDTPVWLLAGGSDKGADFATLADAIVARSAGTACYGAVGQKLHAAVRDRAPELPSACVTTLEEALDWCWRRSQPGDVLLLSPACASYDQFRDYADRAAYFKRCIETIVRVPKSRPVRS
jgi:UDP-N-acetylmuramoylalanine--D-glutamate ligase